VTARDAVRPRFEATFPEETLPRVLERFAAQSASGCRCSRRPLPPSRRHDLEADILSVYSLELLQRSTGAGRRSIEPPLASLVDEVPLPAELEGRTFAESRFRETHALALLLVRRGAAGCCSRTRPSASRRETLVVFGPGTGSSPSGERRRRARPLHS